MRKGRKGRRRRRGEEEEDGHGDERRWRGGQEDREADTEVGE